MSEFDNPFADPSESNPFQDPSVQQARGSQPRSQAVDEFNPFAQSKTAGGGSAKPPPPSQPAVLPAAQQPPPYTASSQQRVTSEELERRQRELEAKARELERREEEQKRKEQQSSGSRNNNWPPLPSFCPVGPCFFQDFEIEIPVEFRRIVKMGYFLWMAHVVVLFFNILGSLAYFIASVQSGKGSGDAGAVFGVSILMCIIFTPCSFICWFRPLYKAFRSDSSFNFFVFFIALMIQFGVLVVQCLGLNYLGSCGWINSLFIINVNSGVGIFMIIIAACFTSLAIVDMILLIRVHRIYRSTGASFEKAKQEFSHGVMTNESVRGAAADMGTQAARGAFSGGNAGRY